MICSHFLIGSETTYLRNKLLRYLGFNFSIFGFLKSHKLYEMRTNHISEKISKNNSDLVIIMNDILTARNQCFFCLVLLKDDFLCVHHTSNICDILIPSKLFGFSFTTRLLFCQHDISYFIL